MSSQISRKNIPQRFGQKLRALRTYHSYTLKTLALALGHIAHGHISEIEAGKKTPTVEFVLSVSRLFNVSTDHLLRDELELDLESSFIEIVPGEE